MTQCELVLRHLQDYGSITSLEAVNEYGIMRLASRIHDIKDMGFNIEAYIETGKNRYGEHIHYTRYRMVN